MTDELQHCWLIGGTSDSAAIAQQLSNLAIPYVVTVTTGSARRLYPAEAQVEVGKLSPQLARTFLHRYRVSCIADASHPFADEISRCAIALSQDSQIPYLRYERPVAVAQSPTEHNFFESSANITRVDSIDALVDCPSVREQLEHQRVLFTIGYRYLEKFASLRATSKLYARILPSPEAIAGTLSAGFCTSEIIALRPPISLALEMALWQQWDISCVVAKASGQLIGKHSRHSGEYIKQQAARALGTRLIIVSRPAIAYPQKTEHVEKIISFCQKHSALAYKNL